jgi:hypothetical protein
VGLGLKVLDAMILLVMNRNRDTSRYPLQAEKGDTYDELQ